MSRDSSELVGRGIAALLMLGLAITYFAWGSIVKLGADGVDDDIALWLYDDDAVRGGTIDARVRIDSGDKVRIDSVVVDGAGARQSFGGAGQAWGNTIQTRQGGVPDDATASMDFKIRMPAEGDEVRLVIRVNAVAAKGFGTMFFNDESKAEFERVVALHDSAGLRRALRVLGALGAAAAVVGLLIALRRWFQRRNRTPSAVWLVVILPYAAAGYHVFGRQLAAGLHIHGVLFGIACIAVWLAVLIIPGMVTGPLGLRRYRVEVEDPRDVDALTLESEWLAAGMLVTRKRRWLSVGRPGAEAARVRIPASESFGREPFEIHAADRATVENMVVAAARLLGAVRCSTEGEGELRIQGPA